MTRLRCLLVCVLAMLCVTDSVVAKGLTDPVLRERQRVLLESALAALAPHADLERLAADEPARPAP